MEKQAKEKESFITFSYKSKQEEEDKKPELDLISLDFLTNPNGKNSKLKEFKKKEKFSSA